MTHSIGTKALFTPLCTRNRKLLRSEWHPSTRHNTICVSLLKEGALLADPEKDEDIILETPTTRPSLDLANTDDSVPKFSTWPSFKSIENYPLVLYIPYLLQGAMRPAKLADRPDHVVDDPLYLMTLIIPKLFLKPLQVFNEDFPLYIKHEDLSEIAHGGQCLSISYASGESRCVWIPRATVHREIWQSQFESESYMKNWMQNLKWDVYLGAYLNGAHWQMVIILPKENVVIWFCSLHNRPDNYLKGIINSKSKAGARWIVVKCNRQKGNTECGYYVMHWMSTIILGSFKNNWETYFNDARPLEPERSKALRIQWAKYYLKVTNET
ncbi:hypothetical protein HKD37_16G045621 [Glycine soja]